MDAETIQQLNAINTEFYRATATEFDQTRGISWPGWDRLLPHLQSKQAHISVLDIGCGNGRFGLFLAEHFDQVLYSGVDNNSTLLQFAATALGDVPNLTSSLRIRDVVVHPLQETQADLVVAFGVIHHIPGYINRQAFVKSLADCVAPGGWLVFAAWCFYEFERFQKRITPWEPPLKDHIENHDYLLDWRRGEHALRYCHYVDEAEHQMLIEATGLYPIDTYRADGFTGTVNRYTILKKL